MAVEQKTRAERFHGDSALLVQMTVTKAMAEQLNELIPVTVNGWHEEMKQEAKHKIEALTKLGEELGIMEALVEMTEDARKAIGR